MKRLNVFLSEQLVGVLEDLGDLRLRYTYEPDATTPLSLRLPVRAAPYDDVSCRPFFENLLPEVRALGAVAKAARLEVYQTFELLAAYGRECPGAVMLLREGEDPADPGSYEPLSDDDMAKELGHIRNSPNFARDKRVRMSLAGAQWKTAVAVFDRQIYKPLGGAASTHIVKAIGNQDVRTIVKNEAFCLALAGAMGIPTAAAAIHEFNGSSCLFVERFDRVVGENREVRRLHQEDMCQALGFKPEQKYEYDNDGLPQGPGLEQCLGILRETKTPIIDRRVFLRLVLFNFLIGNADAHGKNFGLLYRDGAVPSLAPAYDLVSTVLYDQFDQSFSMHFGHATRPEEVTRESLLAIAGNTSLRRVVQNEATDLAKSILPTAQSLCDRAPFKHHPPYTQIIWYIGDRVRQLSDIMDLGIDPMTTPFAFLNHSDFGS
jgi:serine/threonine-protein kinase HipA